jgi:SAM-dependent methyltransferase
MFHNKQFFSVNSVMTSLQDPASRAARLPLAHPNRQEDVNDYFGSTADYWEDIYRADGVEATIYRDRLFSVLKLARSLALPNEARILEVGCGAGLATVELARLGYSVQAVDAVPAMIARTRRAAAEAGVENRVDAQLGDVRNLTFADDSFHLVIAVGVLPWVNCLDHALCEMARVTRPGGHLILTLDNAWRLNHIFDPRCFPAFRPLRRKARLGLQRLGLLKPGSSQPRHALCAIGKIDRSISSVGLRKVAGLTLGFGPFTLMGCKLFSDSMDIKINRILQKAADRGFFLLRSCGVEYIVLAQKPHPSL